MGGIELKKFFSYVNFVVGSSKLGFFASSILYVCNILFAAGLYAVASFIISLAALHPTYDKMMIPVVCVRMFGIGRAVLSYSERYVSHDNTFKILKQLRIRLYDKMKIRLPDYETRRADYLSQMIVDVELLQEGILRLIYPFVSSLLLWIGGVLIILIFSPLLALVYGLLFLLHVYMFPLLFFYINTKKKSEIDDSREKLYEDFLELKEGIFEITANGNQQEWVKRIETQLVSMNGNVYQRQNLIAICEAILSFLQGMSNLIFLLAALFLFYHQKISGIYLASIMLGLSTFVTETMLPSQTYFKFGGLKRALNTVFSKETENDTKPENEKVDERINKISDERINEKSNERINEKSNEKSNEKEDTLSIQHIGWKYKNGKTIFLDFSLEVKKGSAIAVIGESGVGKSTLVHLILGFLKPKAGHIYYGGKDILKMQEEERMELFSVVDQKPFFFHQTIYENLKLANPKATEEQIEQVLQKVQLVEFIEGLSKGLHTFMYEWGANLSGGELQRLAIARALLKESPIYIFDEPTAGLDTIHEKIIMEVIVELAKEHGVILITHRKVMLERFDEVVMMS